MNTCRHLWQRPLGSFPYVYLDARYEKVRHGGVVISSAVLLAIGVSAAGQCAVLGTSVALSTFRKKIYSIIKHLQEDLDAWLFRYNNERTHQGEMCCG